MQTVTETLVATAAVQPAKPALVRESVLHLKPYVPGKPVEEVKRELGIADDVEVIKLASNENLLGPSPLAVEAMKKAAEDVWAYPDDLCFNLKKSLATFWNVEESQIILGNGSDEIIHFLALAMLEKDDEIVVASITFGQYQAAADLVDCVTRKVPVTDDMRHDLRAMKAAINERTKIVFIANPNNPTGTTVTKSEFAEFMEGLPPHVLVVLDQAYYEYVKTDDSPEGLDYVKQGHNIIVLHTFSKVYALAGLRVGYAISTPEITSYLQLVRGPFNVNMLAQAAALASLNDDSQIKKAREANAAGLAELYAALDDLGLSYVPSEANFVLFDLGRDAKPVQLELMKRGIIVRAGFGLPTYVRVTIGTSAMNERFISSLREVLSA